MTQGSARPPGLGRYGHRRLAAKLGRVGIWSFALQRLAAREETAAAQQMEALGFETIWIPESVGSKDVHAHSALLLSATSNATFATGIANIHARDPMAMANGAKALGEAFPGRYVLGIGVSHAPTVELRGGDYGNPLDVMARYLDAMSAAQYGAPEPDPPVPLVLAALGPRMLDLAAERADGAHPYFVPVEHTEFARRRLGAEPCLATEVTAVLTTDRQAGMAIARAFAHHYLVLPNYANNLRRVGWSASDVEKESDAIVEAVVVVGDIDAVVARVQAHLDAGADHVCVQFRAERSTEPSLGAYRELASAFGISAR